MYHMISSSCQVLGKSKAQGGVGGVLNGRGILTTGASTAVDLRGTPLQGNLLPLATQFFFGNLRWSGRGSEGDAIIVIVCIGRSGREFVPGIFSCGDLNLAAWKRKRRRDGRYRARKVEFGVGASQAIRCSIIGAGGLLLRFVRAEPYIRSAFGHPDFGSPTTALSQADSLKLGAFLSETFTS